MNVIQFPQLSLSFQNAMDEVLADFFSTGKTEIIGGNAYDFWVCERHYTIDKIEEATEYPRILFTGSRWRVSSRSKCMENDTLVNVTRGILFRTCYVTIPRSGKTKIDINGNIRLFQSGWTRAQETWGLLNLIFTSKRDMFIPRGIENPMLDPFPVQVESTDFYILQGSFQCVIQYTSPKS